MTRLPTLFLSHESPLMWDTPSPARSFLQNFAQSLVTPKAIVVISAHWQEKEFSVSTAEEPETIHDFSGFARHYFDVSYPCPGAPELGERILELWGNHGINGRADEARGLDHAVWLPVGLMYPQADIPVVSVSQKLKGSAEEHYKMGEALKSLRDEGILVIGSGTATHNLGGFFGSRPPAIDDPADERVVAFSEWLKENIDDPISIVNYRKLAPFSAFCHPTADHFLPLIAALGAGTGSKADCIHHSFNYSYFAMTSFLWR